MDEICLTGINNWGGSYKNWVSQEITILSFCRKPVAFVEQFYFQAFISEGLTDPILNWVILNTDRPPVVKDSVVVPIFEFFF